MIDSFNEYQQQRYQKMVELRDQGIEPYPTRSGRTHSSTEAILLMRTATPTEGSDHPQGPTVTVAGRVSAIRIMGKAAFVKIQDGAEQNPTPTPDPLQEQDQQGQIQLYFKRDIVGEEVYNRFKKMVDLGDFIEATGPLFVTRTNEVTVEAQGWTMLAKAINQPPEKYHGLTDTEQRYRERYADLLGSPEVRDVFIKRARITSLTRQFMEREGFIECETPILQPLYGGAAAKPFVTHHNYAKRDLYLRIADELYLKRLLVGGFEKVYEIGKDFRNEGISFKHNNEFTMLEAYQAYADYTHIMSLVERCWSFVAEQLFGRNAEGRIVLPLGEHTLDLTPPWDRVTMQAAILQHSGVDIYTATTLPQLREAIADLKLKVDPKPTWGKQVDELFGDYVEPHLIQPTILLDYPREISPFAKQKPDNPHVVERFEFFMGGAERGNAFTELNDPLEQYERFLDQQRQVKEGDDEGHPIDTDFINALMYGMPPTGGIGWGMDRMAMVLLNQTSIREVILFPALRVSNE